MSASTWLGGQRQRALLAVLLLRAGEVVPTERLVDLLWGEDAPKTATTSLQNSVSQLRKLLGPDVLVTRSPGYVLRVERGSIDTVRFERLLGEARLAPPERRAAVLREALALWRGPALAEFAAEGFAQGEMRRLEELRLVALSRRTAGSSLAEAATAPRVFGIPKRGPSELRSSAMSVRYLRWPSTPRAREQRPRAPTVPSVCGRSRTAK